MRGILRAVIQLRPITQSQAMGSKQTVSLAKEQVRTPYGAKMCQRGEVVNTPNVLGCHCMANGFSTLSDQSREPALLCSMLERP